MPQQHETRKAPVWTTVWNTTDRGCWHVQWGRESGPEMGLSTIKKLSDEYFVKHEVDRNLKNVRFYSATPYGRWEHEHLFRINEP
jgi:hypothetical protein